MMIEPRNQQDKPEEKVLQQQKRKPYVTPQLKEYGSVKELTHGASGVDVDGEGGFFPP